MQNSNRRWADEEDSYLRSHYVTQTHAQIGKNLGRSEKAVRTRCYVLGLRKEPEDVSAEEIEQIREWYESRVGADLDLASLAQQLGRPRVTITRKAAMLGLTDPNRSRPYATDSIRHAHAAPRAPRENDWTPEEEQALLDWYAERRGRPLNQKGLATKLGRTRASISHKATRLGVASEPRTPWGDEVPHPRGFAGKTISSSTRARLDEGMSAFWDRQTPEARSERALQAMKTRRKNGNFLPERQNTTWKQGWLAIGGKRHYFRSKWEANYAHYLEWLKGLGEIAEWEYEPETFWFEAIKRGTRSYTPDFRVTGRNGNVIYHEVKGWFDDRSKTQLNRMAKCHPAVRIIVIDSAAYKALAKKAAALVPGWGTDPEPSK